MKAICKDQATCIDSAIETMELSQYPATRLNVELGVKVAQIVIQRINDVLKAYETTLTTGHALPRRPVGNTRLGAGIREQSRRRQSTPSRFSNPSRANLQSIQDTNSQSRHRFGMEIFTAVGTPPNSRGALPPEYMPATQTTIGHHFSDVGIDSYLPLRSSAPSGVSPQQRRFPFHMQRPDSFAALSARDSGIDLNPARLSSASKGSLASRDSPWHPTRCEIPSATIQQQRHNPIPHQDAGMTGVEEYIDVESTLLRNGMYGYSDFNQNGDYGGP